MRRSHADFDDQVHERRCVRLARAVNGRKVCLKIQARTVRINRQGRAVPTSDWEFIERKAQFNDRGEVVKLGSWQIASWEN